MPWRHPVGLDALLPSCRACKAAALFVWHRHAGPHRRDPLRRSHAPSTSLHRVAVPCSTPSPRLVPRLFCARRPVRLVLHGKVAPLRGCASVVPPSLHGVASTLLHGVASASLHGVASTLLHGVASASLHGVASASLHGVASTLLHGVASTSLHRVGSTLLHGVASTSLRGVASTLLHGRDDARKAADLRRRSPSPGGELQQKCEAMGTVALHRGFPLMRMIFFDKTPPWDPCLWGEVE